MNLSEIFIRRPVATVLLTIGAVLLGVIAYFNLPVASLPNLERPTIAVRSYLPGGSPDTILRKSLRKEKAMAKEVERYHREYCVTDGFLQELDKMAGLSRANTAMIQERRISYVLTTGANWAGPIKNFHLLIDKGSALVSYCEGNLNSSSNQILDVSASDFVPDRDLKLLFVGRF